MANIYTALYLLGIQQPPTTTDLLGMLNSVGDTVSRLQKNILAYSIALAAVGAISMALLQTVKDLTSLREWFQRWRLRRLLGRRIVPEPGLTVFKGWAERRRQRSMNRPDIIHAESILIQLATAGDKTAFYQLQVEQMCGQIIAVLPILFDSPSKYAPLLVVLASAAESDDMATLLNNDTPPSKMTEDQKAAYAAARARIMNITQRSVDGIQIRIGSEWQTTLRGISLAFSVLITGFGVGNSSAFKKIDHTNLLSFFEFTIVGSVLGGFLAPVARDVVAALQGLRLKP